MNAPERPESFERREPELPNSLPRPAGELEALKRAWKSPRGLSFITDVNNTYVGLWYVGTAFLFFILAGILALIMRAQLAVPESDLVGHDLYNQLFTMHGTVMMFLFAVPAVEAASVYLLPNMQAARDLPFPRLSAYAFWAYFVGGLVFFGTIFFGLAPNGGWFMYPPLTSTKYSPADNADWWLLGIGFIEISAIAGAIEIIVGVMKTRAVGMSLDKLPVYSWAMLVFAVMIVIGFPAIILGTLLLEMERAFDWPFFIAERGGDPLLWQHLFWFFGHPEVYIIFLPADRHGVDDRARHGADAARRLPAGRARADRDRLSLLRPVGPPHVRDGPAEDVPELLLRGEHGGGGAERHPGLRLDRHHRIGPDEAHHAVALRHRLPVHLHAGRPHRRDGRHGALRLAGA